MTYKEKLQQNFKNDIKELMMESCPGHYYTAEPYEKCNPLKRTVCEACWNREISSEEEPVIDRTIYETGLNDVWITLKKFSNLSEKDRGDFFNTYDFSKLLENFTPQEVLKRMNYYEKSIKKGDIIELWETNGMVTRVDETYCYGILFDGDTFSALLSECKKVGRYYDLTPVFKTIRGEKDEV